MLTCVVILLVYYAFFEVAQKQFIRETTSGLLCTSCYTRMDAVQKYIFAHFTYAIKSSFYIMIFLMVDRFHVWPLSLSLNQCYLLDMCFTFLVSIKIDFHLNFAISIAFVFSHIFFHQTNLFSIQQHAATRFL